MNLFSYSPAPGEHCSGDFSSKPQWNAP